jgi:hypothetical protein
VNETGNDLRVNVASIIDQLHNRYGKQLAQLFQENSELSAAQEAILAELDELRSKLSAIQD